MNPHLQSAPIVYGHADITQAPLVAYAVHGRNQQPEFMAETANRIAVPNITYVLPRANGCTWYPESFLADTRLNEPAASFAHDAVDTHLRCIEIQGVPAERTVLLGFSQGACLLAEYLLRTRKRYAGAALLTGGYLGPHERTWSADEGRFDRMPVLLTTSARDEWVPLARVHATTEAFAELGASVRLHVDDDPVHRINDEVAGYVRHFLTTLTQRR